MKKTIFLFLLLIPVAYAFTGSNANYNIGGNFGLGAISEHSNGNFTTKAFMQGQPIGQFESENYSVNSGLYYLEDMGYYIDIEIFNILLNAGWNLISIPLVLDNKTLGYALSSIEGNYTDVFSYLNSWMKLENDSIVNETIGFWIKMINEDMLVVEGTKANTLINLEQGWNLIGYPSLNESLINKTLNISKINSIFMYNNSKWYSYNSDKPSYLNTLTKFIPGFGYWIKTTG